MNSSKPYSERVKNALDTPTGSGKNVSATSEESGLIRHSPEPKSSERKSSDKTANKVPEEKKPNEQRDSAAASEQKQSSEPKTQ